MWFLEYKLQSEATIAALQQEVSDLRLAGGGADQSRFKRALNDFFRRKNPEMLPKINKLLVSYSGKEQELFAKLGAKYGEPVMVDLESLESPERPEAPQATEKTGRAACGLMDEEVVGQMVRDAMDEAKASIQVGLEERLTVRLLSKFTRPVSRAIYQYNLNGIF